MWSSVLCDVFKNIVCAWHFAGLYGRFPDVLPIVAAKFQTLELRNTSMLQCNASNVQGLETARNGTVC